MVDWAYLKAWADAEFKHMKEGYKQMFHMPLKEQYIEEMKRPPPPRNCFECEAIASAFFFSTSVYFYYLSRMGRIQYPAGITLVCISAAAGGAVFIDQRPYAPREPFQIKSDSNNGGNQSNPSNTNEG